MEYIAYAKKYINKNSKYLYNFITKKSKFYKLLDEFIYDDNLNLIFNEEFEKNSLELLKNEDEIIDNLNTLNNFYLENFIQKLFIFCNYLLIINKVDLNKEILDKILLGINTIKIDNLQKINLKYYFLINLNYIEVEWNEYILKFIENSKLRIILLKKQIDKKNYLDLVKNIDLKELFFEYYLLNILFGNTNFLKIITKYYTSFNISKFILKNILEETFYIYELILTPIKYKIEYYSNQETNEEYEELVTFLFFNYSWFINISKDLDEICSVLGLNLYFVNKDIEMIDLYILDEKLNEKIEKLVYPFLNKYKNKYLDLDNEFLNKEVNFFVENFLKKIL